MNLISLTASQQRCKIFEHPMFGSCVQSVSEDTLHELVVERIEEDADPEELILALRSCARYLIGRYLWHWPVSRAYLDEMVGEAMLAVTMLVNRLSWERLNDRPILKVASQHICDRVEEMLNKMVCMGSPCVRVQKRRAAEGELPSYIKVEREPLHGDRACPQNEEEKFDMLDAIAILREECDIASRILDPDNWGLSHTELGEKLGLARTTVARRRIRLFQQYQTMIGEDE